MKTLYLLRHAKSSWDEPGLADFERPLSRRGADDVPVMAERFLQRAESVDCMISSPATRARTTATLMANRIEYPTEDIISNPELYFAGTGMFLKVTSTVDESCESTMLVGHNPAITDFANMMARTRIDNIPTCGLVELSLPIERWSDVRRGDATLVNFDYPRKQQADGGSR